jgi:hypothetical protein
MPRILLHDGQYFVPENGVNQGCPLASRRFGGSMRCALRAVCAAHPAVEFVVVADDVSMRAPDRTVASAALASLQSELKSRGLDINLKKCWRVGFDHPEIPAFVPGSRLLGAFLPLADPASHQKAAQRAAAFAEAVQAGKALHLPGLLHACVRASFRPALAFLAAVGNLSPEAAAKFDTAVANVLAADLSAPTQALTPHTAGLPALIHPLSSETAYGPIALASALLSTSTTRARHRYLAGHHIGAFWSRLVPDRCRVASDAGVPVALSLPQGGFVVGGKLRSHATIRQDLALLAPAPPRRGPPPGAAALALALCACETQRLTPAGWSLLVNALYPAVKPAADGKCPLCRGICCPDHASLCTHPHVAAARTRRHYRVMDVAEKELSMCPTVTTHREPHVHKAVTGTTPAPKDRDCRADLHVSIVGRNISYLADLKIINSMAKEYHAAPNAAAASKQKASQAEYMKRTGRTDVRTWVFTTGGDVGSHASADLARLARELGVQKEYVLATLYATLLNAHADVHARYAAAVSRSLSK